MLAEKQICNVGFTNGSSLSRHTKATLREQGGFPKN